MNRQEKCGYWLMLADYDLDTIDVLIQGERWVYVAFLCQQAVERQLKAMYVYITNTEPPKTHNLSFLFSRVTNHEAFLEEANSTRFLERKKSCEDFCMDLMFYYMSDYPFSYQNIATRFVNETLALELTTKTRETVAFLRSFLPPIDIPKIPS